MRAKTAPIICVTINKPVSLQFILENVSLNVRAIVTTGFAKLVEAVNQYGAAMYNATSAGTAPTLCFTPINIETKRPKVVIISEKYCHRPVLAVVDSFRVGNSNIIWADVPLIPPRA